jgi:hypothetical protein
MKLRLFIILLGLLNSFFAVGQHIQGNSISDTLKVVVQTTYGELTFTKYCKKDKLEFIQSKDPIINEKVEEEARQKNIEKDRLKVRFYVDERGKITDFRIVKKSRIETLNSFLIDLFNNAILKMRAVDNSLNCNNRSGTYTMPLNYIRQKPKKADDLIIN